MCQMWTKIRYGVRWNPAERLALGIRALDLQKVCLIVRYAGLERTDWEEEEAKLV